MPRARLQAVREHDFSATIHAFVEIVVEFISTWKTTHSALSEDMLTF